MESTRLEQQRVLAIKLHNSFNNFYDLVKQARMLELQVDLYINNARTEFVQRRRLDLKTLVEL